MVTKTAGKMCVGLLRIATRLRSIVPSFVTYDIGVLAAT